MQSELCCKIRKWMLHHYKTAQNCSFFRGRPVPRICPRGGGGGGSGCPRLPPSKMKKSSGWGHYFYRWPISRTKKKNRANMFLVWVPISSRGHGLWRSTVCSLFKGPVCYRAQGRGRYFWMGVQTFSMGLHTAWAPWSKGPYHIFYCAFFTDTGAFFKS